jgi:hypothetical protein
VHRRHVSYCYSPSFSPEERQIKVQPQKYITIVDLWNKEKEEYQTFAVCVYLHGGDYNGAVKQRRR